MITKWLNIYSINKTICVFETYMRKRSTNIFLVVTAVLIFLGFFRLETVPPLWWDEGWTLSVARNWVELGHYGRVNAGEATSARLSASLPVVASVAASFKVLDVGVSGRDACQGY
jgi:hypothetical protein